MNEYDKIITTGHKLPIEDLDFLLSDDVRGIRLQLDYLKAESVMSAYGIQHTIVVFGSARIKERSKALENLHQLETLLNETPDSDELKHQINKVQKILSKSIYYDIARKFGEIVGKSGNGPDDSRLTLMTGGGPGIMEAANRGASEVGAKSIGLNIQIPHEQFPNPYITPELCFKFHYFAMRKLHFLLRAKAFVIFPGGFGTLDEFFELLLLIQTNKNQAIPIVMIGEEYWSKVINFDFLKEEGVISPADLDLFVFAQTADDAWQHILDWYKERSISLF